MGAARSARKLHKCQPLPPSCPSLNTPITLVQWSARSRYAGIQTWPARVRAPAAVVCTEFRRDLLASALGLNPGIASDEDAPDAPLPPAP